MRGIAVKNICINNSNRIVMSEEYYTFENTSHKLVLNIYKGLKDNNVIINSSYEDDTWQFYDSYHGNIFIKFDTLKYTKELKYYCLILLHFRLLYVSTVQEQIRNVKDGIFWSHNLEIESLYEILNNVNKLDKKQSRVLYYLKDFLLFLNLSNFEDIYNRLPRYHSERNVRNVAGYYSAIVFDSILRDYMLKTPITENFVYYPLFIWWELSTIIPMRPVTITLLPIDCANEIDGKYYITINRPKTFDKLLKAKDEYAQQTFEISKKVYDLIELYKKKVEHDKTRTYLLSTREHVKHSGQSISRINNPDIFKRSQLSDLLSKFYREIVTKKYNYKLVEKSHDVPDVMTIQKMTLGDTRHYAFCSLMLQGVNPYIIAELGGHKDVKTQLHYSTHIDDFINSSINTLADSMAINICNEFDQSNVINADKLSRKNIFNFSRLGDKFYELPMVDGGRCTSENIPYTCLVDDCIFCLDHFVYDPSQSLILDKYTQKINQSLNAKIEFIKIITKNVDSVSKSPQVNEKLKSNSEEIKNLIHQKALIETYRLVKE